MLIVEDCKQQHWEGKRPVFHPIILEDLEKYIEKWKEDPRFSDKKVEAFDVYMDLEVRIDLIRADYEQRLIRAIKGLSIDYTILDQYSQTEDDAKKYKTISESVADE